MNDCGRQSVRLLLTLFNASSFLVSYARSLSSIKLTSASAQFLIPLLLKTRLCHISQSQNVGRIVFEGDGDTAGSGSYVVV